MTPFEWKQELEYKRKAEIYGKEAIDYRTKAYAASKIYNNFDSVSFQLIKARYDYKIGDIETENIVKYFVYDKSTNKIVGSFNKLGDDFISYYYKSVKGIDLESFGVKIYDYEDLLNQSLDSLTSLLD